MTNKYRSLEHKALEVLSGKKLLTKKQLAESQTLDLKEDAVTSKKRVVVADPDKPDRRRVETTITGRLQFQTPARLAANKKRSEKAAAAKEEQKNQVVQESKEEFNEIIMEERKVSSQAANNFMNHRPYKNKNTKVIVTPEQTELYLHGNLIAKNSKRHGVSVSMAGAPVIDKIKKADWSDVAAEQIRRKDPKYQAYLKKKGKLAEEENLTEKSLLAKWKQKKKLSDKIKFNQDGEVMKAAAGGNKERAAERYRTYEARKKKIGFNEEVEGLARTLSRGKEELPKMQDHRLKGQFSKNLLEAVQKVMAEKKTVFKDSFAEGVLTEENNITVGSIVYPNKGPHKGFPHKVIHVDGDHFNITPLNLTPKQNRYHLGAASAHRNELSLRPKDLNENLVRTIDKKLLGSYFQKKRVNRKLEDKADKLNPELKGKKGAERNWENFGHSLSALDKAVRALRTVQTTGKPWKNPIYSDKEKAARLSVNAWGLRHGKRIKPGLGPARAKNMKESEELEESAKQYNSLLKKWKTAKGSEKAELKKKMDAIKANSKVTAKAPAPKSAPKVSATKKQPDSDESTYLDKVLKGQFPWGNVGKETAKAFRSKLMTIQKPRDREMAMKHAMKSSNHFDQVMSGKALKEENGDWRKRQKKWEQRGG